ncbi:MFS transporter [Parahaliea maris]|uniref:MFS transporter n=1 Tax=Parahaliea maris TaxID=2716870 RepID=A0A5C8ZXS8_9GAMM|nr:MFS transporter [Parahaliea maris]TXS92031.1 MFS transporter [Parahaliea maris]
MESSAEFTSQTVEAGDLAPRKSVPRKTMILYGFGQTGAQLFRDSPAALLPLFMTTMLGVAPWLAGIVVLIPKLWVIICDPFMGALSDQYKPRHGRRPFLAAGAVLTSLGFISLFSFSGFSSQWAAALTVGLLFFLASTAFSAFSVPYLAVASELSEDPHERTTILAFRMIFAVAGVIMGVGLAQPLVFALGGDAAAWRTMAIIFGGLCMFAMLATAFGVPRDYGHSGAVPAMPGKMLLRLSVVKQNRPFMILTLTFFIQSIAQASGYAVVGFVFLYAIADINLLLPFVLVMAVGSVLSQPMWVKLSRRWGKERAFWVACIGWGLVTITWLWIGPGEDVLVTLPLLGELSTQHSLVLVRALIIGCTNSGFSVLTFSLLTDTIELQRRKEGSVDEGLFSGIFSATEKLAFALGPVLAGLVLSAVGFQSSTGGAVPQDQEAIRGMIWLYSTIPAGVLALSLAAFTRYHKAAKEALG